MTDDRPGVIEQERQRQSALSLEEREAEHFRLATRAAAVRELPPPDRDAHRVAFFWRHRFKSDAELTDEEWRVRSRAEFRGEHWARPETDEFRAYREAVLREAGLVDDDPARDARLTTGDNP